MRLVAGAVGCLGKASRIWAVAAGGWRVAGPVAVVVVELAGAA